MNKKPNVILITTDEMRKDVLSYYGNRAVATPNIDRLADRSTRYERAYTPSPLCLPARWSILTGCYPHTTGAYSNFRGRLEDIPPNLYTLYRDNGYKTAHVGKCHYAPMPYSKARADMTQENDETREYYKSVGMEILRLQDGNSQSVRFYDDYSEELEEAGYLEAYRNAVFNRQHCAVFEFPAPKEWHPDSWVGSNAVKIIDNQEEDTPLFMWVSFSGPHYPFNPPAEYLDRVDMDKDSHRFVREGEFDDPKKLQHRSWHGEDADIGSFNAVAEGRNWAPKKAHKNYTDEYWYKLRKYYYANMALIDDEIGEILDAVERKFGNNTLIIFTTDHGELLGNHGLWGKNGCIYDDVWSIPLFLKMPGQSHGGNTDIMVSTIDILPTCLKACGLESVQCDGRDLEQSRIEGGHPYVFAEAEEFVAVRDGRYKYIHTFSKGKSLCEMYDLKEDFHEINNIVDEPEYAVIKAELQGQIINLFTHKLLP